MFPFFLLKNPFVQKDAETETGFFKHFDVFIF